MLKDIIINWKVTLINAAGRYSNEFILQEGRELEQTAIQKYQSAQNNNGVFSIRIFNVLILAFRHIIQFVLIYLYQL